MPFPEVKRVIYGKNPLDRVTCQLKFPPILRIEAEVPARFQDRIREKYPNYSKTSELNVLLPSNLPGDFPIELVRQTTQWQTAAVAKSEFSSEDGHWRIDLTRDFIALTTNKYTRWEEFVEQLERPLMALTEEYKPQYFSRVGLRYIDVIRRSKLGIADESWSKLLQPHMLGLLGSSDVADEVVNFESKFELALPDGNGTVRISTRFVLPQDDKEICYMIDSDFFSSSKTQTESVMDRLNYFNKAASALIQWCITERLHKVMEPEEPKALE
jgi:uncharacterized protein (TIGR04255 family)